MYEFMMDKSSEESIGKDPNGHYVPYKDIFSQRSPRSPLSTHSPESDSIDLAIDGGVDISFEHLCNNVCEMQSSDQSLSRRSFFSYGEESRIDSELRYLAGGDFGEAEIIKGVLAEGKEKEAPIDGGFSGKEEDRLNDKKSEKIGKTKSISSAIGASFKSATRNKSFHEKPPAGKRNGKSLRKPNSNSRLGGVKLKNGIIDDNSEARYLGPYLIKQTKEMVSSGESPKKALELALRAMKSFENSVNGRPNLEFVMCLHVVAALYCKLGQYSDAIPLLERSIEIPVMDKGQTHALAKFAGCMQLGDTYAILGQIENSMLCYTAGLGIQRQFLGEKDTRFAKTCRYVAEAHIQALQFDEAEKLCQMALDIHRENGSPGALEEAADRRLMGLICESKGDYESALEHYVLVSMAMAGNGMESGVAYIDCSIGDAYLSLARYDEAIFAYQKALTQFKSTQGENHPSIASVFGRLANLYNKIGKFRESKSYCENALRIYSKPAPGTIPAEEIATGLIDISAIYESMNEPEQALKLLQKAFKVYENTSGQQATIAGIEAQIGVLYYMMGSHSESYDSLKNAISKFRDIGEKKSALFGIALNQTGLACVQLYAINEAADHFEEARSILEAEYGPYHPETLGVYSNLAGTYDAMGRTDDAIEILEYVVGMREEKLGTANPEVHDEKQRLAVLLKEAGRARGRKYSSLETLLDVNPHIILNIDMNVP